MNKPKIVTVKSSNHVTEFCDAFSVIGMGSKKGHQKIVLQLGSDTISIDFDEEGKETLTPQRLIFANISMSPSFAKELALSILDTISSPNREMKAGDALADE